MSVQEDLIMHVRQVRSRLNVLDIRSADQPDQIVSDHLDRITECASQLLDPTDTSLPIMLVQVGGWDAVLDDIEAAVRRRKSLLSLEKVAKVLPGDVIAISDKVNPKKLAGARVRVISIEADGHESGTLLSDLSAGGRKWRYGSKIGLLPSHVGKVIGKD